MESKKKARAREAQGAEEKEETFEETSTLHSKYFYHGEKSCMHRFICSSI